MILLEAKQSIYSSVDLSPWVETILKINYKKILKIPKQICAPILTILSQLHFISRWKQVYLRVKRLFSLFLKHFEYLRLLKQVHFLSEIARFIVPAPLVGGTIYSNGLFFQTILADRYIHRREMWVVLLKSCSSVEFEIKKVFFQFSFFWGVIEV